MRSVKFLGMAAIAFSMTAASATTVPFTESFTDDAAGWRDASGGASAVHVPAGGADLGGYITQSFNFVNSNTVDPPPVFVRAQSNFGSSGNSFFGNWLADGVTEFRVSVRHDAPVPVNFFSRFASPAAFPGAIAVAFTPVFPNTWTELVIPINAANPQFVSFEGSDFATVFSNIGRVQLGVNVPAALAGVDAAYDFDFDVVSIVPEPASIALLLIGSVLVIRRR